MLEARFASFSVLLPAVVLLLQATLLPLCTTLCALNQDGSYAMLPWLTCEEAGKLYTQTALSKAAALEALSLQQETAEHAELQAMQEAAQHTGKQPLTGGVQQPQQQTDQQPMQKAAPCTNVQQPLTGGVQQPQQQTDQQSMQEAARCTNVQQSQEQAEQQLSQEPLQDTEQQHLTGNLPQTQQQVKQQTAGQGEQAYVPQHDKQPLQQTIDQAMHEVSSVSIAMSGSFQNFPQEASDGSLPMVSDKTGEEEEGESRQKEEEDNRWWWSELIRERPGSALPVRVQGLSGREWYAVVVGVAVGLAGVEEPRIRSAATSWLKKASAR